MITKKIYLEAKKNLGNSKSIIEQYEMEEKERKDREFKERVKKCGESTGGHHYEPTNAKWQSASQVECCFCGDTLH